MSITNGKSAEQKPSAATRRRVDIGVSLVLDVRCSVVSEAMLADGLSPEELGGLLGAEMLEVVSRVRGMLGDVLLAAGEHGLVLTGSVTIAGQKESLGG